MPILVGHRKLSLKVYFNAGSAQSVSAFQQQFSEIFGEEPSLYQAFEIVMKFCFPWVFPFVLFF